MSGIQQMLLGGGGDSEIVTVATWNIGGYGNYYGFNQGLGNGSSNDGFFTPLGGAPITMLFNGGLGTYAVNFQVTGEFANAGFESMTITNAAGGVTTLYRNDATYSSGSGSTAWQWVSPLNAEFGAAGTIATVVFS
ncbi:MAG: hypothetical protein EBS41_00425 [Actinobacteria bacterium]|nr:hypothetical protein [Actinomycetota bacterium]